MDFGCVLIQFTVCRLQRGRRPPRRTHAASLRAPRSTFAAAPRPPRRALPRWEVPTRRQAPRRTPGPRGRSRGVPEGDPAERAVPPGSRPHGSLHFVEAGCSINSQDLLRVFSGSVWPTGRAALGAPELRAGVCSGGLDRPSSSHTVLVVNQDSPSREFAFACRSQDVLTVEWGRAGQWGRGGGGEGLVGGL